MSYQVLARKWRPQTFEEVVGQEAITRTLQNAIASGRVAHAFLFSGPRGVGKTSVARILAKALNCGQGPTPKPCNVCQLCQEITAGSSLDVLEIDGASNRGIDEVRDLREKIKYPPVAGKYKVYIIDEVHMLTKEAFNALLKTLEEPPAHAIFVLATTEPHKVPATILSRCQRYDFRRIPASLIQEHLAKMARSEGWELEPEGLALIAREAEGSLRDAEGFLDQVISFGGERVSAREVAKILGITDRQALMTAVRAIVERNGPELLELIDSLYNQGHDLKRFYLDLVQYARHLLLAALHPGARRLAEVGDSEWEELRELAHQRPPEHVHNLLTVLLQGEEELKRTPQPRLALEVLLLRLLHLEPLTPLPEWLQRLENLEQKLASTAGFAASPLPEAAVLSSGPSRPGTPPAPARPSLAPEKLEETWQAFLEFLNREEGGPLSAKLSKAKLTAVRDQTLVLSGTRLLQVNGPRQQAKLQELVTKFFGAPYRLEVEITEPVRRREEATRSPGPLDLATLKQKVLEIFGGRWLPADAKEETE